MRKEIVYSLAALTGIPVMVNASSVTAIGTTTQYRGTSEMAVTPEGGANLVQGKKYSINFPNLWCEEDLTVTVKIGETAVKTATVNAANSTVEFELTQNGVVTITVKPATNKEYSFDAPIINLDYDFDGAAALLQRDLSPIALMIKQFSNDNKTPDLSCYNDLQGIINQILKVDSIENADGKGAAYENVYKKYKLYEVSYKEDGSLNEFDPVKNPVKRAIDSLAAAAKQHEAEYLEAELAKQQAKWDSLVAANPELNSGDLKDAIAAKLKSVGDSIDAFKERSYDPLWDKANDLLADDEAIMDSLKNAVNPASLTKLVEDAIASSKFYKETAKPYVDSLIADFKVLRDELMDNLDAIKNTNAAKLKTDAAAKLNAKGGKETNGLNKVAQAVKEAFADGKLGDDNTPEWAGTKGLKAQADSTFKADSALIEKFDSLGKYLVYIDSVNGADSIAKFEIEEFNPGKNLADKYKSPFLSIPFQEKTYKSALDKFPAIKTQLKNDVVKACADLKDSVLAVSAGTKEFTKIEKAFTGVTDSLLNYGKLAPIAEVTDSFAKLQNYWKLKQDTLDAVQDSLFGKTDPKYQWRTELAALKNDSAWKSWKPLSFDSIDNQVKNGGYQDTAKVQKLTLQTTADTANEIMTGFDAIKKQIDDFFDQTNEAMEIFARVDTTIAGLKDSLDEVRNAVKKTEIYNNKLEVKDGENTITVGGYKAILDSLEYGKATDPKSLAMIRKQLEAAMAARGAEGKANLSAPDSTHTELMKALSTDLFKENGDSAKLKAKIDSLKQNWESDLAKYKASADSAAKAALRKSVIDMCDSLHHDSIRIMKLGYPDPEITDLETALKDTYGKAVAELDTMIKMIFQDLDTLSEEAARAMAEKSNEEANFDTLGIYAEKLRELIKKMDIVKARADRAIKEVAENKKAKEDADKALADVAEYLKKARALVADENNAVYGNTKGYANDVWENGEAGEQDWYRAQIGGVVKETTLVPVIGPDPSPSQDNFDEVTTNNKDSIITDTLLAGTCDSLYHELIEKVDSSFAEESLKKDLTGYKADAIALVAKIQEAMSEMRKKQDNWNAYKNFQPFYDFVETLLQKEEVEVLDVEPKAATKDSVTAQEHYLAEIAQMWIDYQGNRAKDSLLEAKNGDTFIADSMGLRDDIYQDYQQGSLANNDQANRRLNEVMNMIADIQKLSNRAEANKEGYSAPLAGYGLKALWNEVNDSIQAAKKYVNDEYQFADHDKVLQKVVDFETELKKIKPDTLYKKGQLEDYDPQYGDNNQTQKYQESKEKLAGIKLDVARYMASLKANFDSLADATNQQYIDKIKSKTEETREIYKQAVKTQDDFKRLTNEILKGAVADSIAARDREYNDSLATYPGKINTVSGDVLDAMTDFIAENPDKPYKNDQGVQHGKDTMKLQKLGEEMQKMEAEYKAAMKDTIVKEVTKWLTATKNDILGDSVWIDSLKLTTTAAAPVSQKIAELKDKFAKLEKVFEGYKNTDTVKVAELDAAMNTLNNAREELDAVINEAALNDLRDGLAKAKQIIAEAEASENFQKFLKEGKVKDVITFESRSIRLGGLRGDFDFDVDPLPGIEDAESMTLSEWWKAQKALIESAGEVFDAEKYLSEYPYMDSRATVPGVVSRMNDLFTNVEDAFNAIAGIAQTIEEYQKSYSFAKARGTERNVIPDLDPEYNWQYGPYADLYGNFDYSMSEDAEDGIMGDDDAQVDYDELYSERKIKQKRPVDKYFNLAGVLKAFNDSNLFTKFKNNTEVYDGYKNAFQEVKNQITDALAAADQYVVKERMQLGKALRNGLRSAPGKYEIGNTFTDRDSLNDAGAFFKIRSQMADTLNSKLKKMNADGLVAETADTALWNELAREVSAAVTLKKDTAKASLGETEIKPTLFADEYAYLKNRQSDMINLFNEIAANAANISADKHREAKKLEDKILALYAELDSVAGLDSVTIDGVKVPNNPAVLLEFQTKAATLMKELTDSAEADGLYALATARKEFANTDSMVNAMTTALTEMMESYGELYTEDMKAKVTALLTNFKNEVNGIVADANEDDNLLFFKDEYWDKIALAFQKFWIGEQEMSQLFDDDLMEAYTMYKRIIKDVQNAKDKAVSALKSEFSEDKTGDYTNRLSRIQMHIDKASALVADLLDDGEAYYAPGDTTLTYEEVLSPFFQFSSLFGEIEDILDNAALKDLENIADGLADQVDGLTVDSTKLLKVEYQRFKDELEDLQDDIDEFQEEVYDEHYDYDDYDDAKAKADELQRRIDALKQAIGDALIEPTLRGDLNGDGVTDWKDFYILTNAVQTQTEPEQGDDNFDLYNLNGDDAVDVTDIILLRDYCISGEWSDEEGIEARSSWLDKKDILDVQTISTENGVTRLAINLTNEKSYRALQLDLNLGAANLVGATLADRTAGVLYQSEVVNGIVRLFTVPTTVEEGISGNEGAVIYLDIEGAAEISGTATFTTKNYKSEHFDLSGTTAIDKLKNAAAAAGQKVYNLGGRMVDGLKKGVNILRGENGETKKVIKK